MERDEVESPTMASDEKLVLALADFPKERVHVRIGTDDCATASAGKLEARIGREDRRSGKLHHLNAPGIIKSREGYRWE